MRHEQIRLWVAIVLWAVVSFACVHSEDCCTAPGSYPCTVKADCDNYYEVCNGSFCAESWECESDKDCLEGAYCSTTIGLCQYEPYCKTDADCTKRKAGLICNPVIRYCDYPADGDEERDITQERDAD